MSESYQQHDGFHGPRDRGLRAADRDRDSVADILREQHAAGRLDTDEFQDRLDRCYAAKTYAELDALVADLPREERARATGRPWRLPVVALTALVVAAVVLSAGHLLWLAVPLFFFLGRPFLWRFGGRRFGWAFAGCGPRYTARPGTYL